MLSIFSDMAALSFKAMKCPVVPVSAFASVLMTGRLMVCGIKASEIICFCLGLEKNTFARLTTLSTSIPPHQHRLLPKFLWRQVALSSWPTLLP